MSLPCPYAREAPAHESGATSRSDVWHCDLRANKEMFAPCSTVSWLASPRVVRSLAPRVGGHPSPALPLLAVCQLRGHVHVPSAARPRLESLAVMAASPAGRAFVRTIVTAREVSLRRADCVTVRRRCERHAVPKALQVLRRKRTADEHYVIADGEPISVGIRRLTHHTRVHALVVVGGEARTVRGLITSRDLLRALDRNGGDVTARVDSAMTPAARVVHITPDDSITQASLLMSELKIAHLPVIAEGEIHGVVSLQDIADVALEHARGGKESVVRGVLPRRGIHSPTRIASGAAAAQYTSSHAPLFLHCGSTVHPRPQPQPRLAEDAHFTLHLWWPGYGGPGAAGLPPQIAQAAGIGGGSVVSYMGIADGVGSWHAYDVDPRLYATRLMAAAEEYCWRRAATAASPPTTAEVLQVRCKGGCVCWRGGGGCNHGARILQIPGTTQAAWEAVQRERVIGSATAMIISLDPLQSEVVVGGRQLACSTNHSHDVQTS
jgi:CBS domain-containing protein